MNQTVVVRLLRQKSELECAMGFMKAIAHEKHRTDPPPLPQFLFGAYRGSGICGTIGVDFGSDEKPFHLERHWEFDSSQTPLPFERSKMAEIGRWMAKQPGVSVILFYAATLFSLSHRKVYCLAEMKPKIAEHSMSIGYEMLKVQPAELLSGRISKEQRGYYLENPPSLYMLRLEQMHQVIRPATPPFTDVKFEFLIIDEEEKI